MNVYILFNPYVVYVLAFGGALVLYSSSSSSILPEIENNVYGLIVLSMFISILFAGLLRGKLKYAVIRSEKIIKYNSEKSHIIIYFALLLAVVEIAVYPMTPFYLALIGEGGNHKEYIVGYGIKTIHAFIIMLSQVAFIQGVNELTIKAWRIRPILSIAGSLLIMVVFFSRGAIAICVLSGFFLYVSRLHRIRARKLVILFTMILGAIYLFGVFGNVRIGDKEYILDIGGANKEIFSKIVPSEYFWAYIYLESPLGNLQREASALENVNSDVNLDKVFFIDVVPDVLSKRVSNVKEKWEQERKLVNNALTAGTMYARALHYAGYQGALIVFFWLSFIIYFSVILSLRSGIFGGTILALTNTLAFLCLFTNPVVFSSIIGPIFISWLLSLVFRLRIS